MTRKKKEKIDHIFKTVRTFGDRLHVEIPKEFYKEFPHGTRVKIVKLDE